ncbi:FAD/NAD(P)-binding protein [Patescibacteria group bacterium]|nr:FAD/NAD(P)-binding protein [Patescibacteria group bacterium]
MKNNYAYELARVIKVVRENPITNTLHLKLANQKRFQFLPGQFVQIGIPGFGECPIAISSAPQDAGKFICLTIRGVGELTKKLLTLKAGDIAFVHGPYGNGYPAVEKNLILIAGGCGFIPLVSVYENNKNRKDIKIQILMGCRNENLLLFRKKMQQAQMKHDLNLILEETLSKSFAAQKGLITDLLKKNKLLANATVFVCGPPAMYPAVVKKLLELKVAPADIYLTLEKRMHCGVGICQHCAVGTKYVCKDGPIFSYEYLRTLSEYQY